MPAREVQRVGIFAYVDVRLFYTTCSQKRKLSVEAEPSQRVPFGLTEQLNIANQVCV